MKSYLRKMARIHTALGKSIPSFQRIEFTHATQNQNTIGVQLRAIRARDCINHSLSNICRENKHSWTRAFRGKFNVDEKETSSFANWRIGIIESFFNVLFPSFETPRDSALNARACRYFHAEQQVY